MCLRTYLDQTSRIGCDALLHEEALSIGKVMLHELCQAERVRYLFEKYWGWERAHCLLSLQLFLD